MKVPNLPCNLRNSIAHTFDAIERSGRFLGPTAVALILASLAINLGLGRWGSYIGTPIQGLYLPDLLLIVGAFLSLTQLRKARLLPKSAMIFALPLIYFLSQAIYSVIRVPSSGYTLWVRDMAPFAYLSLVPLIALSLASLKPQMLVLVVRWSAIIYAITYAAANLELIRPWASDYIASDSVFAFSYRGDFTGFAMGIGIVAWGRWHFDLSRNILIQGFLLSVGLTSSSRAAFVTLLALALLSVLKDWSSSKIRSVVQLLIVTLLSGILLSFMAVLITPTQSQTATIANYSIITVPPAITIITVPPAITVTAGESGTGTALARIDTSIDSLRFLATGTNWVFGGGPGTDTLYFACTGIRIAPEKTILESNNQITYLPKCAVDSNEALSTLRDPHNWVLNLLLYHGFVGLLVFTLVFAWPLWTLTSVINYRLSAFGLIGIFIVGSFGVVVSAPFGLVPLTLFLAYLYANTIRQESLLDTTRVIS